MSSKDKLIVDDIDIFDNSMDLQLHEYCSKFNIDNMVNASQSQWNGFLIHCNKHIFSKYNLKSIPDIDVNNSCNNLKTNHNKYNTDLLLNILNNIYIPYCMNYGKEISIIGFSLMIGCDNATIQAWAGMNPSDSRFEIYKKLVEFREESLTNKLSTGKQNPVGVISILNHHYNWAMAGVTKELSQKDRTMIEDAKTAFESFKLEQNNE